MQNGIGPDVPGNPFLGEGHSKAALYCRGAGERP